MKVLFITRKYPPSKGGMEKISYGVINNFPELNNAVIIAWGKSQKGLIFFIPWIFLKTFYLLIFKKVEFIHFGDCALSFIGYFFKKMFKIPMTITAHGLDLTYNNKLYQLMIKKTLNEFDKIICVSTATQKIAVDKGVEFNKCIVINDGIDTSEWYLSDNKKDLKQRLKEKIPGLEGKFLLLSVGRLVKRKGINWFIKNVFTKLEKDYTLLIVGQGDEEKEIKETIHSLNLNERVLMLGKVSDGLLKLLYNSTDIFIMPNIPVYGDMEGFGIVAIEAASCGLPVVATNIEGIKDAIKEGKNGFLIKAYDIQGYIKRINTITHMKNLSKFKKKQIEYTCNNYDLKNISYQYYSLFKKILKR